MGSAVMLGRARKGQSPAVNPVGVNMEDYMNAKINPNNSMIAS